MRSERLAAAILLVSVWTFAHALNPPTPPDDPAKPAPAPAPAPTQTPAPAPTPAPTQTPAPAPPATPPSPAPAAKKAPPSKPAPADDAGDDDEKAAKKAPRRFIPTDKGKADEDIPYPVDI